MGSLIQPGSPYITRVLDMADCNLPPSSFGEERRSAVRRRLQWQALTAAERILEIVVGVAENEETATELRLKAASIVLDRALGRPPVMVEGTDGRSPVIELLAWIRGVPASNGIPDHSVSGRISERSVAAQGLGGWSADQEDDDSGDRGVAGDDGHS